MCGSDYCTNKSYSNNVYSVVVKGFSNYSLEEGMYCGDGVCNNGETCSTCSVDCGECTGGGGSDDKKDSKTHSHSSVNSVYNNYGTNPPKCMPKVVCTVWSKCENNVQSRTCRDLNNCSVGIKKETKKCDMPIYVNVSLKKLKDHMYESSFDETTISIKADTDEPKFLVLNKKNNVVYYAERVGTKEYTLRVVDEDLVKEGKLDDLVDLEYLSSIQKNEKNKNNKFWMYWFFLMAFLSFLLLIKIVHDEYQEKKVNKYAYKELVDYVKNSDLDRETLIHNLEKVGWDKEDIEKALKEVGK